jgi:FkbM family methyltransferase
MKLRHDLAALLPRIAEADLPRFSAFYQRYAPHLGAIASGLYDRLPTEDQARLLLWMLKRWGKVDLVNPVERGLYQAVVERARSERREDVTVGGRRYKLRDFGWQGHDFQLACYDWVLGVHDVLYDQYELGDVQLRPDDVIIDAGAFVGDTAVLFHHKLGGRCTVHSFELLDENLALLVHNLARNGVRDEQVVLNKLALADRTGGEMIIASGASQGATSIFGRDAAGERVQTITLDDYVVALNLPRVDFIKMDIEGAEVMALQGAQDTIRHFQPRLAICLYHQWDDVFAIPRAIQATGVDYAFRFKWVQLTDGWEAVLLAIPAAQAARPVPRPAPVVDDATDPLAVALQVLTRACARKGTQADPRPRDLDERGNGPAPAAAPAALQASVAAAA